MTIRLASDECASALVGKGTKMAKRIIYKDGRPVRSVWLALTLTKEDKFYRISGRIVSRNLAAWAIRSGLIANATIKGA